MRSGLLGKPPRHSGGHGKWASSKDKDHTPAPTSSWPLMDPLGQQGAQSGPRASESDLPPLAPPATLECDLHRDAEGLHEGWGLGTMDPFHLSQALQLPGHPKGEASASAEVEPQGEPPEPNAATAISSLGLQSCPPASDSWGCGSSGQAGSALLILGQAEQAVPEAQGRLAWFSAATCGHLVTCASAAATPCITIETSGLVESSEAQGTLSNW